MKITGIQIVARKFEYKMAGIERECVYTKSFQEMTVDTDKGNRIITKKELLEYLEYTEAVK